MDALGWLPLVFWGVIALAALIFVHEGGHFLTAKLFGLKVYEFMLGLPGPKLVTRRVGETEYGVTAIPFGGYVKFAGSDPFEELEPEDVPRSFPAQPLWKKVVIIGSGPLTNLAFAFVAFVVVYQLAGIPTATTRIARVLEGSAAAAAGLRPGDRIVEAGGVKTDDWNVLADTIHAHPGEELPLVVRRGARTLAISSTPAATPTAEGGAAGFLGIEPSIEELRLGLGASAKAAWQTQVFIVRAIAAALAPGEFVRNLPEFRGPIGIAEEAVKAARRGAADYVWFVALISLSLGIFNLLPVPPLDGGRVVISLVERARNRPLDHRTLIGLTAVGASLLVTLMVYLVYSDLARLLT